MIKSLFKAKTLYILTICILFVIAASRLPSFFRQYTGILSSTLTQQFVLDDRLIFSNAKNMHYIHSSSEFIEIATTNSLGYRDKEIPHKDRCVYRILMVGDSLTYGHGIAQNSETYPKMLEKYLTDKGKTVEVFNVAVRGYSTDQEYRQIQEQLFQLHPDMIVWNISSPGDLYDAVRDDWISPSLYTIRDSLLIPRDARMNWIYIGKYVKEMLPQSLRNNPFINMCIHFASRTHLLSGKPFLSKNARIRWTLQKLELQLMATKKITDAKQIKLVVAILPYAPHFKMPKEDEGVVSAFNTALKKMDKNIAPIIDVKKAIVSKQIPLASLYFKNDFHPNTKGTEVFASVVGEAIYNKVQ